MTQPSQAPTSTHRPNGPNPGILAMVSLALLIASLVAGAILTDGPPFVSPFSSAHEVATHYQQNGSAVRLTAMLQFASAVPLGIYAATTYARYIRLGVRVPGPVIGLFGGIVASMFMMTSALITWVLGRPEINADVTLTHAMAFLALMTGGIGYVVGSGLLVAGVAVPALILGLLPRKVAWLGLVIAVLSELSFLAMTIEPMQFLLPIGRFGGLLWLIAAGFLLPNTRKPADPQS